MRIKKLGLLLGPILFFLILLFVKADFAGKGSTPMLALMALMLVWWILEAVPLAITAMLPLLLFPLFGIMKMDEAGVSYANPVIFLFMGGFMLALGLEKSGLHERIALHIVKITGTKPSGLVLGFLLSSALLSMWISNTATAVMMLPIALSVQQMFPSSDEKIRHSLAAPLMLSIAYGANIGGTMTLIGTPPNIVMAGMLDKLLNYQIGFMEYMVIGFPTGLLLLGFTYLLLILLFKPKSASQADVKLLFEEKLHSLGAFSRQEWLVTVVFGITAGLWIFQEPFNGLIGRRLLNDAMIGLMGGMAMFIIPAFWNKYETILRWSDTEKLPWGILLLFGGGLCMASGLEKTGIVAYVTQGISLSSGGFGFTIAVLLIGLVLLLTEVMSNVALITVMLPPIIGIATAMGLDPLSIAIPATIASSMAFSMPISTPPNAIVFASGQIKTSDMLRAGLLLNVVAILVLSLLCLLLQ
jgi:sodium-dependent dicarboxylate transporter 2/3/5